MSRAKNATKQAKQSSESASVAAKQDAVKEEVVEATPEVEDQVEAVEGQEQEQDQDDILVKTSQMFEMTKMLLNLAQQMHKEAKNVRQRVNAQQRRRSRMELKKAANKKKGGSGGLKKLQPVYTSEFRDFVEKNHQELKDKSGEIILATLEYDTDSKNLMVSRESCLKLVNAYVRQHELQQYENDKKRIKMDATLKTLFPELAEQREGKKVTREENCYFHTLMGGINSHLKAPSS